MFLICSDEVLFLFLKHDIGLSICFVLFSPDGSICLLDDFLLLFELIEALIVLVVVVYRYL
jgi:hypothetical protein